MRKILFIMLTFLLSSCTHFEPKDLKSPCVASPNHDKTPTPCIKRQVNDNWLV